jgi:hypothetical protein
VRAQRLPVRESLRPLSSLVAALPPCGCLLSCPSGHSTGANRKANGWRGHRLLHTRGIQGVYRG